MQGKMVYAITSSYASHPIDTAERNGALRRRYPDAFRHACGDQRRCGPNHHMPERSRGAHLLRGRKASANVDAEISPNTSLKTRLALNQDSKLFGISVYSQSVNAANNDTGTKHRMPADVQSAFDVAFWLSDTALNCNEYLQPQKLQRLLFLCQGYYTVVYPKRGLMPAHFVADEIGPIEPNVFLAFTRGRPNIDVDLFMPHEVETFLDPIWRSDIFRRIGSENDQGNGSLQTSLAAGSQGRNHPGRDASFLQGR